MEDLIKIKNMLLADKITYKEAIDILKKRPKPWTTKYWKEMRQKLIKNICERCGTTDAIMVLQHTKQPRGLTSLLRTEKDKIINSIKNNYVCNFQESFIEEIVNKDFTIRKSCPKCKSINVRYRETFKTFICGFCNNVFLTPIDKVYYPTFKTSDFDEAKQIAIYRLVRDKTYKEIKNSLIVNDLIIGKISVLKSIDESIEYLSFKHTKTLCKRCAAIEDSIIPEYVLCKICGKKFHNPKYEMCFICYGNTDNGQKLIKYLNACATCL